MKEKFGFSWNNGASVRIDRFTIFGPPLPNLPLFNSSRISLLVRFLPLPTYFCGTYVLIVFCGKMFNLSKVMDTPIDSHTRSQLGMCMHVESIRYLSNELKCPGCSLIFSHMHFMWNWICCWNDGTSCSRTQPKPWKTSRFLSV